MVALICRYCGQQYLGDPGTSCCPHCASIAPTSIRTRTCRECGREFPGGPRAWYCSDCREERKRVQQRESNERRKAGTTRKLGSSDICIVCGESYVVAGSNQRYCPACAQKAVAAIDHQQGRQYGSDHKADRQARRQAAKAEIACAICGKLYIPQRGASVCSPECARMLRQRSASAWEAAHAEQRNAYHRQRIADKVSAMTPEECAEYRANINAKAREAYAKRKEKKDGNDN